MAFFGSAAAAFSYQGTACLSPCDSFTVRAMRK